MTDLKEALTNFDAVRKAIELMDENEQENLAGNLAENQEKPEPRPQPYATYCEYLHLNSEKIPPELAEKTTRSHLTNYGLEGRAEASRIAQDANEDWLEDATPEQREVFLEERKAKDAFYYDLYGQKLLDFLNQKMGWRQAIEDLPPLKEHPRFSEFGYIAKCFINQACEQRQEQLEAQALHERLENGTSWDALEVLQRQHLDYARGNGFLAQYKSRTCYSAEEEAVWWNICMSIYLTQSNLDRFSYSDNGMTEYNKTQHALANNLKLLQKFGEKPTEIRYLPIDIPLVLTLEESENGITPID